MRSRPRAREPQNLRRCAMRRDADKPGSDSRKQIYRGNQIAASERVMRCNGIKMLRYNVCKLNERYNGK